MKGYKFTVTIEELVSGELSGIKLIKAVKEGIKKELWYANLIKITVKEENDVKNTKNDKRQY